MHRAIALVTGETGSGKTTVSDYLVGSYYFAPLSTRAMYRYFAQTNGNRIANSDDFTAARSAMQQKLGADIVMRAVLSERREKVVVDDAGVPEDIRRLREAGAVVVSLHCPPDIRYARVNQQLPPGERISFVDFVKADDRNGFNIDQDSQSIWTTMGMADYRIDTFQPLERVFREVDKIVQSVLP